MRGKRWRRSDVRADPDYLLIYISFSNTIVHRIYCIRGREMEKISSTVSKPIMYGLLLLFVCTGLFTRADAAEIHADLILFNGQVVTVDNSVLEKIRARAYKVKKMTAQFPIYQNGAIAIKGKEIVAVGTSTEIVKDWQGPKTKTLDLNGKVVIPDLIGSERMARWAPLRSYFEHGVICPNGSDYPVTTHNPWMGIYFMLTREIQAQERQSFGTDKDEYPDETVGISEALISACAMGPYSTFAENWKGSIKKGHVADLVILDIKDIFDLERNPKLLWEMENKIVATLVDGEIRYQRNLNH